MSDWDLRINDEIEHEIVATNPSLSRDDEAWHVWDDSRPGRTVAIICDDGTSAILTPAEPVEASAGGIRISGPLGTISTKADPGCTEWLDAGALDRLPESALILADGEEVPRRCILGVWQRLNHGARDLTSDEAAPARLLWMPEVTA